MEDAILDGTPGAPAGPEPSPEPAPEPAAGGAEGNPLFDIIREELERKAREAGEKLAACEAKAADLQDRYLRAAADLDNYKKRVAKERAEDRLTAVQDTAAAFLPVADSLERALASAKAHAGEGPTSPVLDQLIQGVELTLRQMATSMERVKVAPVLAERGQAFDPTVHQALLQEPHAEMEEGSILEVLQRGYTLEGRVLRPTLVKVSRKP